MQHCLNFYITKLKEVNIKCNITKINVNNKPVANFDQKILIDLKDFLKYP